MAVLTVLKPAFTTSARKARQRPPFRDSEPCRARGGDVRITLSYRGSALSTRTFASAMFGQRSYTAVLPFRLERSRLRPGGLRPCLCSLIHTQRRTPSSVYLDPARKLDASTSSTPDDLSPSQRKALEAALRIDQAGEVAANYIYAGQVAVLRRDPATAALIQASTCTQSFPNLVTT